MRARRHRQLRRAYRKPGSCLLLLAALALAPPAAAVVPPGFFSTTVLSGLQNPTAVRFAPDGRIFVIEQRGLVLAFSGPGDPTPDVVADLTDRVTDLWDQGLVGLAIDPAFPAPGRRWLYLAYSVDAPMGQDPPVWNDLCPDPTGVGCPTRGRLSRIEVDAANTQVGPEQVLIDDRFCTQYLTHSVGDLRFGPEGALYMSAGEGASFSFVDHGQVGNPCGDPMGGGGASDDEGGALRSQDVRTPGDPTSYDGALIRLDVSSGTAQPWPTNPLVGVGPAGDDAIIAHGFRNPFRFNFRPGTPEIWIADVGWETFEELNRMGGIALPIPNFGWPCYEGVGAQPGYASTSLGLSLCQTLAPGAVTAPFYSYDHQDPVVPGDGCGTGGSSITGVAFYTTGDYAAAWHGAVFFGDAWRNCIWAIRPDVPGGTPNPANRVTFVWGEGSPVDLEVGPGGDLYWVDFVNGRVVRVESMSGGANAPPVAALVAAPTNGPPPLAVTFDASGSSDPEGAPLQYVWDLDGDGAFDDAPLADPRFAEATYTAPGAVTAAVRVTDAGLSSDTASVQISVANRPPVPTIGAPPGSLLWRVADLVAFEGSALDPDEGPLPASALAWRTLLHHCTTVTECHTHGIGEYPGASAGAFIAPNHDYPSFLEVELTARDGGIAGWFDADRGRRRALVFDNSGQATTLTDFPVLVALDATRIDYGRTQNAGQDLRFVDPDGSQLAHEIERWDESGTSLVWVRVPAIDGGSTADFIHLYYDNALAPDAQDPAGVWGASFAGVWHLDPSLADSTANANDGANQGSADAPGRIGASRSFDGNDGVTVASSASLQLIGAATFEGWIRVDDPGAVAAARLLDKRPMNTVGYALAYGALDNEVLVFGGGTNPGRATGIDLDTGWHWIAAWIQGNAARVFVDGEVVTTDAVVSPLVAGTQGLELGRRGGGTEALQGDLDEIRISNVARSDDWIAAQYRSMTDSFVSYGPEEQSGALSATTSVLLAPETRSVDFLSSPSGLDLVVGPEQATAPFTRTLIVNSLTSVSGPSPQTQGGEEFVFSAWSDGGAPAHELLATPGLTEVTAAFACTDTDGDAICDGADNCPTVANADQLDSDADAVGQACDTCPTVANPRVPAGEEQSWMTLVSGQRDDDGDGTGNRCDFDHDQLGLVVNASDFNHAKASFGGAVAASVCGTAGTQPCGRYDHDEQGLVISAEDFNLTKARFGKVNGPSCGVACKPPFGVPGKPTCSGPAC